MALFWQRTGGLVFSDKFVVCQDVSLLNREKSVVKDRADLERQSFEMMQAVLEGLGEFLFVVEDGADLFVFFTMGKHVADFSLCMKVMRDFFVVFCAEFQSF